MDNFSTKIPLLLLKYKPYFLFSLVALNISFWLFYWLVPLLSQNNTLFWMLAGFIFFGPVYIFSVVTVFTTGLGTSQSRSLLVISGCLPLIGGILSAVAFNEELKLLAKNSTDLKPKTTAKWKDEMGQVHAQVVNWSTEESQIWNQTKFDPATDTKLSQHY